MIKKNSLMMIAVCSLVFCSANAQAWWFGSDAPSAYTPPSAPPSYQEATSGRFDLNDIKRQAYRLTGAVLVEKTLKQLEEERDDASTMLAEVKAFFNLLPTTVNYSTEGQAAKILELAKQNYNKKNKEYLNAKKSVLV